MKHHEIESAWSGAPECRNCGIRHLVLFADLNHDDFRFIHEPISKSTIQPGDYLYRAGDAVSSVFTIRDGQIKLLQLAPGGGQRIVRILHRGDLAGIERIVGQKANHDAIALTPVAVCEIPVAVIDRLSQATPRIHKQLMKRWGDALNVADAWLTDLSTGPARSRVARLIIWLSEHSLDESFYLPSREDIGAMLGITTETASRMTAEFRREGLLNTIDTHRATADVAALKPIARF